MQSKHHKLAAGMTSIFEEAKGTARKLSSLLPCSPEAMLKPGVSVALQGPTSSAP
jgi:hypothetical protein